MTPERELESEDEEAPEEVTFQSARSRAEQSAREKRAAASREKALVKEKRKRKEELFKDQKKRKLLSDDILQTVTSLPDKREEPSDHPDEQNKEGDGERRLQNKRAKKLLPRKSLQDNYKVVHLKDHSTVDLQQQKAKEFIQSKLYGKSKNRITANEFLSLSRKKDSMKKPAVQFTDNTWGEEEKKRAANFNLVWANRQKL